MNALLAAGRYPWVVGPFAAFLAERMRRAMDGAVRG